MPLYYIYSIGAPAKRGGLMFVNRPTSGNLPPPPPPLPAGPTIDAGVTACSEATALFSGVTLLPASGNYTLTLDSTVIGPYNTTLAAGGLNILFAPGLTLGVGNHTLVATGVTSNVSNVATTLPGSTFTFNFPTALAAPVLSQTAAGEITITWALIGTNAATFVNLTGLSDPGYQGQVMGNSVIVGNLTPDTYTATVQGSSDAAGLFAGNISAASDPVTLGVAIITQTGGGVGNADITLDSAGTTGDYDHVAWTSSDDANLAIDDPTAAAITASLDPAAAGTFTATLDLKNASNTTIGTATCALTALAGVITAGTITQGNGTTVPVT